MTTPILIKSDNVSCASCSQDVTCLSKSVKESMWSPLNVGASISTSIETVVTVGGGFLPAHHQKIAQTNCEKLEPILSTCRPRRRTAEADTSTRTRRHSFCAGNVALLRSCKFLLCRLSLSLSLRCWGFGVLLSLSLSLVQLTRVRKELLHFRHPSTPSALSELSTARRSHDRPHNTGPSTEAPQPLMSFYNPSVVDRVICLFRHTDCTNVNARVNCAVTKTWCIKDKAHAPLLRSRDSTLPPAHTALSSKSQLRSNSRRPAASDTQEHLSCLDS